MGYKKRFILFFLCIFILPYMIGGKVFCAEKAVIKTGDLFPEISLKMPGDQNDVSYLGLSGKSPFLISDIKADLLLVEIMNINCGSCQRQAPIYNKLYSLIESTPETKGRIKMMAIAAGNPDKYIKEYREHFKAPYPIIEDPALDVFNAIGKSAVPFAIYVRPILEGKAGVVAGTHEGLNEDHEAMFQDMKSFMEMSLAAISKSGSEVEGEVVTVEPILTEEELMGKIETAFNCEGASKGKVESIDLKQHGIVHTAIVKKNGSETRLFAKVVSQPPPCGECHDTHFIYVFDETGKIRQFVPLQLTKYGNEKWNSEDIEQIRGKVVGNSIQGPFNYDEKVDAVSSATITSLVIFRNLSEGQELFKALKTKGWIK